MSIGGDFKANRAETKIAKVEPFNSTKKRMCVLLELAEGGYRAHCKGASEIVLAACDKFIDETGGVSPLDKATANKLNGIIDSFASEALRTLCLAYREMEEGFSIEEQLPLQGYTCIAIVGIKDLCLGSSVSRTNGTNMTNEPIKPSWFGPARYRDVFSAKNITDLPQGY
jgi:Ca2+-transporting ATPase